MAVGFSVVKQFQGVNLTDDPKTIADNELSWAQNCYPYSTGIIGPRKRQGQCIDIGTPGGSLDDIDQLLETTLTEFVDAQGKLWYLMWDSYATEFRLLNPQLQSLYGTVYRPDTSGTTFPRSLGYPQRPGSVVYNNKLFVFPGHTFSGLILATDDLNRGPSGRAKFQELGTTWTSFTGAAADRPKFSFGDIYRDTFVLGGLGPPYESLLAFTQGIDGSGNTQESYYSLLSVAKWAGFGFGDGDKLINYKSTPVTGGSAAIEPYGLAFKRRSVWMLQGDVPTTTDDGTLVVTPVMRGEGLVSSHAVCVTPYGVFWCSGRNVWFMPPGQRPVPIGNKIKGYLSQLAQTDSAAWFLTFCDDILYLNCPSSRAGMNGRTEAGASFLYPQTEQWWCDLRNLDQPKWWGPQDVKASHMISLQNQAGLLAVGGIASYYMTGGGVGVKHMAFELNDSNPITRSYAVAPAGIVLTAGVATATVGAHTFRIGESLSLVLAAGDAGNLTIDGLVVTATTATTVSWADSLANYVTGFAATIESTLDLGNDLEDISTDAGDVTHGTTHQLIRTKEFDFGDPMLTKILECIEVASAWNPSLSFGSGGLNPWEINPVADGGADSAAQRGAVRTPSGIVTPSSSSVVTPSSPGFALDQSIIDADSVQGGSIPLYDRFIAAPVFPLSNTRFLFRTMYVEMQSSLDAPGNATNFPRDLIRRRWRLQSLGFRVRPIGRRPGGTIT